MSVGELWRRLMSLAHRSTVDRELEEEIRLHIELRAKKYQEAGFPEEEACFTAKRKFGNSLMLRERSRELWAFRWLDELAQDIRFGARLLLRSPLFTIVDVLMLRQLSVTAPDQLVLLSDRTAYDADYNWSYPLYEQFRDHVEG